MRKHLTKPRIVGYGLLLAAAGVSAWSLSYAQSTAQADGMAAAPVAAWGNSSTVIDIHVNGLCPGKTRDYIFSVTNTGDGVISKAGQDYSIGVETTGNLPLGFALTPEISSPDHGGILAETGENGRLTSNNGMVVVKGGYLSHFASIIHTYTLAVTWSEEQTGTEYADEIDLVTLTVSSEQTIPVEQQQEASEMRKMGRNGKRTALVSAIAFMLLLFLAGIAAACYTKEGSQNGVVEVQTFHFASNLLNEDEGLAIYSTDPMAESLTIQLCNFADSQRVTSTDIVYRVSTTRGAANGNTAVISGIMNTGEKTPVPPVVMPTTRPGNSGGPLELGEIKVVAESELPYKKTLTGVFKRQLGNQYVVEDGAGHIAAVLTTVCGDDKKDIRITLSSGMIPDEANIRIKDYKDDQCTFCSPGYGIYSLVLLKSEDDIVVSGQGSFADVIDLSRTDG